MSATNPPCWSYPSHPHHAHHHTCVGRGACGSRGGEAGRLMDVRRDLVPRPGGLRDVGYLRHQPACLLSAACHRRPCARSRNPGLGPLAFRWGCAPLLSRPWSRPTANGRHCRHSEGSTAASPTTTWSHVAPRPRPVRSSGLTAGPPFANPQSANGLASQCIAAWLFVTLAG